MITHRTRNLKRVLHILMIQALHQNSHFNDTGPSPEQIDTENCDVPTTSSVLLPDPGVNIEQKVRETVHDIVGENVLYICCICMTIVSS